ncbi:Mitochondrial import receptor subunit TOM70 [Linum perenne]
MWMLLYKKSYRSLIIRALGKTMEKLKSLLPDDLKTIVGNSTPDDLPSTSSSLLDFLLNLPQFHQMVKDLAAPQDSLCRKNKPAALELKKKGNRCFSNGDYAAALDCYSKALRVAPQEALDDGKSLLAALYLNRASAFHKLDLLQECLRDCNRALQVSASYSKAWYRRGKTNAALGNHQEAILDLDLAKNIEISSAGKRQIEGELNMIMSQWTCASRTVDQFSQNSIEAAGSGFMGCNKEGCKYLSTEFHPNKNLLSEEPRRDSILCVKTHGKGRGMVAQCDIPESSLVHKEEPYALVILKNCRENHCHYCLCELPLDTVPCLSCSVPLYCSQHCQVQAGGKSLVRCREEQRNNTYSDSLGKHVMEVTKCIDSDTAIECFPEHKHECGGVHWPAVLPPDVVLAGRVLTKHLCQSNFVLKPDTLISLGFSHNYSLIAQDAKLEVHIYASVLMCCLQYTTGFELPVNATYLSQIIILLSQIRVNAMAIVRVKSDPQQGLALTSNMEQVITATPPSTPSISSPNWSHSILLLLEIALGCGHDNEGIFVGAAGLLELGDDQLSLTSQFNATSFSYCLVPVGQAIYITGSMFNHSCRPNVNAYFLSRTLFVRTTEFVQTGCPLELSYGPQVGQWDSKDRLQILEDKYSFRCQCRSCSELNVPDLVLNAFRCAYPNCIGVVLDKIVTTHEINRLKDLDKRLQLNGDSEVKKADIKSLVLLNIQPCSTSGPIQPGYCLKCGCVCDLVTAHEAMSNAWNRILRLEDALASKEISSAILSDASRALDLLRSVLHPYNKRIAEAEDKLAQAFCWIGDLRSSEGLCKSSIEILEVLYGGDHIVIGYELIKLASIQLSLNDPQVGNTTERLERIFHRYLGMHADLVFPFLGALKKLPAGLKLKLPKIRF